MGLPHASASRTKALSIEITLDLLLKISGVFLVILKWTG